MACCAITALAQPVPPPASSAEQEQRRSQERYRSQRQQLEPRPDVRLTPAPASQGSLPAEPNCFVINQLGIKAVSGEQPQLAARFGWVIDSLAEPDQNGLPIMRRCVGPAGVSLLLKRAQDALVARGYVTSRIVAEPQDLSEGEFTLTLMPGRINAIRFAPGSSPRGTLWNAVPAKPGDILNLRDIEQALENFKRIPTAEADIQIEPAVGQNAKPNQSDLVIRYQQAFPFRASLSLDDGGSRATGKYQGALTISYDNFLTLNDLLYVIINSDLGGGSDMQRGSDGNTAHYSVPFGHWLLTTTASNSRYNQSVVGLNQTYVYKGNSNNVDIKLARLVYRDASRKTTLAIRAFRRASSNFIDDTEIEVQRRVVGGFEASAQHREFIGRSTLDVSLAYKRGTGAFGSLAAPEQAVGEGTSRMQLTTLDAALNVPFKLLAQNMRYSGTLRSQTNHTPLSPQDRFAIGGRYTVRGFDGESSLSAERGTLLRNELGLALGNSGQELYAGIDYGEVSGPSSEFLVGKNLSGAAIGLRGAYKGMQYDVFAAKPLHKPVGFTTSDYTVGVSFNFSF
ncbi:MAG: ShlB/FhaC/HecB family hemolysin secretion/activation protein [Polaromonas sp.]